MGTIRKILLKMDKLAGQIQKLEGKIPEEEEIRLIKMWLKIDKRVWSWVK
jgi:hypothetical protein